MARLLSRVEAAVSEFTSSDQPGRDCVHVTPEYSEATQGHYLVRVPAETMKAEDFPVVPGMGGGPEKSEFLVKAGALLEASKRLKKSTIPICNTIHVGTDPEGNPVLTTTDLDNSTPARSLKPEGTFPNTDKVIPDKETLPIRLTVNAAYLAKLCNFAVKYGLTRTSTITLMLPQPGEKDNVEVIKPIRAEFQSENGPVLIVLMPCRP